MRKLFLSVFICLSFLCSAQDVMMTVGRISVEGNRRTKEEIIYRELPFATGDSYSQNDLDSLIQWGENNVFNTHLFNQVEIRKDLSGNSVNIVVSVRERWYIWPVPILEFADPNFNLWWETQDFNRLNYGLILHDRNFRGRDQDLYIKAKTGYTQEFKVTFHNPYINEKMTLGGFLSAHYQENREVNYGVTEGRRDFFNDDTEPVRTIIGGQAGLVYRPRIFLTTGVSLEYQSVEIVDSLFNLAPQYLGNSNAGLQTLRPHFFFVLDKRDVRFYALNGFALDVHLQKFNGINESDLNLLLSQAAFRWYKPLKDRLFFSASAHGGATFFQRAPYAMRFTLGYTDYVRGYENYVIDADHFAVLKTNFKFALLPQRNIDLGFGPSNFRYSFMAIYFNIFADAGYTYFKTNKESGNLSNQWLPGGGVGIDFVTYYDKVLRLEISMNKERKAGLFIHFAQPI